MKNKTLPTIILGLFLLALISAGQLQVTNEHPFLIDGEWTDAQELNIGNEMTTIDGKRVRITGIEKVVSEKEFPVYNLEAGVYHDFVVCGEEDCVLDDEGVVVHNSNALKAPYKPGAIKSKYSPGTKQWLDEEVPVYHYFYSEELINKGGRQVSVWESMVEDGFVKGSSRTRLNPGNLVDKIKDREFSHLWVTTVEPGDMAPSLLKSYLHGGTMTRIPGGKVGVLKTTMSRKEFLKAYSPSVLNSFNQLKLYGYQYGSSFIELTAPSGITPGMPLNHFSSEIILESALGVNKGATARFARHFAVEYGGHVVPALALSAGAGGYAQYVVEKRKLDLFVEETATIKHEAEYNE